MDIDAALSEVPVNIMPLIDDTDFKTRETGIVYNSSGMDLVWNFVNTSGAYTQTAVTPTTGGDYDWAHQGDGMYSIEIPDSGGASINNDTEGFGWFSGFVTGVLPWRGPTIGFRAAGLNDLLIDSAYSTTRGLTGTALPAANADAAGGLPISDAGGLALDTILDAAISTRLAPTDTGRTLDVTATGAAGIDWANVENQGTSVDLSATSIDLCDEVTLTDTATDVTNQVTADVTAISGDSTAADNAESFFDGTGYAGTNNVIPNVTLVATTTTNTDMRGTDSAALASVCTEVRLAELDAGNLPADVAAVPAAVWTAASAITTAYGVLVERIYQLFNNRMTIVDATGATVVRTIGNGADLATSSITDDGTDTVRTENTWP
jgi:hypothetical protein